MPHQFADRVDAIAFLASHLRQGAWVSNADAIAEALVDEWALQPADEGSITTHRAMFRPKRWVIRNQDLGLLDGISGVLQGAATGGALALSTGSLTLGLLTPAIAVVTQLLKIHLNVRKKGVRLSESEFLLLSLVMQFPSGASVEILRPDWAARFGEEAVGEIEPLLEKLAKYPNTVGETALIWKGSDGLWRQKDLE